MVNKNGMDLTEAEDIKKRWQEYAEELYRRLLVLRECRRHYTGARHPHGITIAI